jgi:hypothetical protein
MAGSNAQPRTIDELSRRLREIERGRPRLARDASAADEPVSTGIEGLDRLLPERGFPAGTLAEWLAEEGAGAGTLALLAAQRGGPSQTLVVIDSHRQWYAPAACARGLDLGETILVRPQRRADALWALEQALRCPAVGATVAWFDRLQDRAFRRLKLAAEQGRGVGFLLRPTSAIREPSWADVRLLVEALPALSSASGRRIRVELLRCRGGFLGGDVQLMIDDVSNSVRLVPDVAPATALPRASGA